MYTHKNGPRPCRGPFPTHRSELRPVGSLTPDRSTDIGQARAILDDYLTAHADLLPQFRR